jgi:hypothetical protein
MEATYILCIICIFQLHNIFYFCVDYNLGLIICTCSHNLPYKIIPLLNRSHYSPVAHVKSLSYLCYRTLFRLQRSFLKVNTTREVPERYRFAATVYSRTHLLCVFFLFIVINCCLSRTVKGTCALICLFTVMVSTRGCFSLASSLPKQNTPLSTEMILFVEIQI